MIRLQWIDTIRDRYIFLALILVSVLIRLPFLDVYDLVAYDGTYYINIARSLLDWVPAPGPFPLGYSLLIAPLLFLMDGVRAAQVVSFVASLGSLIVIYKLVNNLVGKRQAVLGAFALAVAPVFVRFSLMALSESAYVFWVLLSLLLYHRRRFAFFGLSAGMAAITRPEAIGIFAVLAGMRVREGRKLAVMLVAFIAVYAINVAVFSDWSGKFVLLQKTENVGLSAANWQLGEAWIDFEGRESLVTDAEQPGNSTGVVAEYFHRFPRDVILLVKHVSLLILGLAVFGMSRKRLFILAALLPFFVFPLFTPRSSERFILPFVPIIIIYGLIGIQQITRPRLRAAAYVLFVVFTIIGMVGNMPFLLEPSSDAFASTRDAAREFGDRIDRSDKVADRKPYFAFYAGARFNKLPAAPYEETLQYLYDENVKYLSLHHETTHNLRPALRPLLYDKAMVIGEMRYEQAYFRSTGELIYERRPGGDPLRLVDITPTDGILRMCPAWSPDGRVIAYREALPSGKGEIAIIAPDASFRQTVVNELNVRDPISWGPRGERMTFANQREETMSVYIYNLMNGEIEQITGDEHNEKSPFWSHDGSEIAFASDRSGGYDIYVKNLVTGRLQRLTGNGGNGFPSISPDGTRLAYVRDNGALMMLDRATKKRDRITPPEKVVFTPTWSPDSRFLIVAGEVQGGHNLYLITADGSSALILTKSNKGRSMPSWSRDGQRIALVTADSAEEWRLTLASGFGPYIDRLLDPPSVNLFGGGQ